MDFNDGQGEDAGDEVNNEGISQMSEEEDFGQMREREDLGQMGEEEDPGQVEEEYGDSEDGQWILSQIYSMVLIWLTENIPIGPDVLENGDENHEELDGKNEIGDMTRIRFWCC